MWDDWTKILVFCIPFALILIGVGVWFFLRRTLRTRLRVKKELKADTDINEYVDLLARLRKVRGEIIYLKDLRYSDADRIESLDQEVAANSDELSSRCVGFLLQPESLSAYHTRVEQQSRQVRDMAIPVKRMLAGGPLVRQLLTKGLLSAGEWGGRD